MKRTRPGFPAHTGSRRRWTAGTAILLLALLAGGGCSDNPKTSVLIPPGGRGDIVGTLTFENDAQPPFPVARILAFQNENPDCVSPYGAIAVMGTLNNFDLAQAAQYSMSEVLPCLWVFETHLDKGLLEFKFVTGYSPATLAFDNPGDYGVTATNAGTDPLEGTLDNPANGPDGNVSLTVPSAGDWTFEVNEAVSPATYRLVQGNLQIESDAQTGQFQVTGLPVGTYDVSIEVPDYLPKRIGSVEVLPNRAADLGVIAMTTASGRLGGSVDFADHPDPRPLATVQVMRSGGGAVVQTAQTDSAFAFTGLDSGTYDVTAAADGYLDTTVVGISYVNGQTVDVGTLTLQPGCRSQFTTIQLAGDFNAFNLTQAPFLVQGPNCVWTDTLTLAAGTYNMKFVTNGAFDTPKDYGGDEGQTLNVPGVYPVKQVSGTGTALRISVATAGKYLITLNEQDLTFTAELQGGPTGSITGTAAFSGIASAPFPRAVVRLFRAGSDTALTQTTTDASTRAFKFQALANGVYDLEVSAPCYITETRTNVSVSGSPTDVGTVSLAAGSSSFTTIQLAADFTSFDLGQAPAMTEGANCVWTDTVTVAAAGTFNMKFVTDGAFDTPKDYGGDESQTLDLPGSYPVRQVSGTGTALHIRFANPGAYAFSLDERRQTFTVTLVTP